MVSLQEENFEGACPVAEQDGEGQDLKVEDLDVSDFDSLSLLVLIGEVGEKIDLVLMSSFVEELNSILSKYVDKEFYDFLTVLSEKDGYSCNSRVGKEAALSCRIGNLECSLVVDFNSEGELVKKLELGEQLRGATLEVKEMFFKKVLSDFQGLEI